MMFSFAVVTTVAGSGVPSFGDGTGFQAGFNQPTGMAVDASGTVYVSGNQRVRKINPVGGAPAFVHVRGCHHASNGHVLCFAYLC